MNKYCIITCGSKKCVTISKAENMYVGNFFKAQLKWAKKNFEHDNIFILSAKYGLLKLTDKIKGKIYSSAGKSYRVILDKVFKDISYPFAHLKGMGYMIGAMLKC